MTYQAVQFFCIKLEKVVANNHKHLFVMRVGCDSQSVAAGCGSQSVAAGWLPGPVGVLLSKTLKCKSKTFGVEKI